MSASRRALARLAWLVVLACARSRASVADDLQLNTYTAGWQYLSQVTASVDGSFICSWASDGSWGSDASVLSIQARRFAADGSPLGPEFQVNSFTFGAQFVPDVAMLADGRFVVAWSTDVQNNRLDVRAQPFGSDGRPVGPEIAVNTVVPLDELYPSVSMDASGGFLIVWESGVNGGYDVRARRFASDGTPFGDDFRVNTYTSGSQQDASVAVQPGGGFVVAWSSDGSLGNDSELSSIQARRYAADGSPFGPEFQVNTYTAGIQARPAVAVDPQGGGFVVTWDTTRFDNEFELAARRFAADGTPLGDEFLVNTYTTGWQMGSAVAVAPGGDFLAAFWNKPAAFVPWDDCSTCEIRARRFHADGTPYAPEFLVNSYTTTAWRMVNGAAADGLGNFIVTWESDGSPGDDQDGRSVQGAREVAELQITNDDGVTTAVPGGALTYTITASHVTGLQAVVSATVVDAFSPLLACTWTCLGTGGGACASGPVAGPIADPVVLPVGSSVTYTADCTISPTATGSIATTASVTGPPGLFDPVPSDNTATDVDGLQGLVIDDVSLLEGSSGSTVFGFTVTLASPQAAPVTVDYGTEDGTATVLGGDYLSAAGTLSFAPGETTKPVTVSVIGDAVFEADETFFVTLSNAVGSFIVDGVGLGRILNDDSALPSGSRDELVHGSAETRSLETQPGPVAIAQEWRLRQAPYASYEVLVDAVTGDLGPGGPALDRLASDGSVVQSAVGVAGGSSRSLRFENHGLAVTDGRIRVQSRGCILDCDAADRFRVRLFETTLHGARFNNSASQVTVVVVQNPSSDTVTGHLDFWSAGGTLLHSQAIALPPRQTLVLNTSTVGALQGQAGSLTVSHDGRYGGLMGKAVAVEPATGFSFDTALEPRRP